MWNREDFLEWKEKLIKQRFVILLMEFSDFSDSFLGSAFVGFSNFQLSIYHPSKTHQTIYDSIKRASLSSHFQQNRKIKCFSHIKYVLKKGFYIYRFLLFCCSNKVHSRKFGNNEMYHSQILIYWQLCWRESPHWKRKEKLRIETRFKELWNESIRLSRFTIW